MSRAGRVTYKWRDPKAALEARTTPEPNTGCWLWTASMSSTGYGNISRHGGKVFNAHRYSYEVFVGPVGEGLQVLHKCDNRACINPAHLFLGTQRDNMHDMMAKGRKVTPAPKAPKEVWRFIKPTVDCGAFSLADWSRILGISRSVVAKHLARVN